MATATFRVDASVHIGTGHVMRCVVLANALRQGGVRCHFLMREQPGQLAQWVLDNGHTVALLPANADAAPAFDALADAAACLHAHGDAPAADWLIVDHYGIDERWERAAAPLARRRLVVDDLADRPHHCELLLDQNAGREPSHYRGLVGANTRCLAGPSFALLAPDFAQQRPAALARRATAPLPGRLLLSMGGVDRDNFTAQVLRALGGFAGARPAALDVVLGPHAPHIEAVRSLLASLPMPTRLHVNTRAMAQLMSEADLAIGAGGVSALERCVLGLPGIVITVAANQLPGSRALAASGAVICIEDTEPLDTALASAWARLLAPGARQDMSQRASQLCDGQGSARVVEQLLTWQ